MEQQKLINDKNELFESLKSEFANAAKTKSLLYCLFGLILVIKLLYETFHQAATIDQLIISVSLLLYIVIGALWINWYHKIAKTDNAQEFLTIYNKKKMIEIISIIIALLVLVGILISTIKDLPIEFPLLITLIAIADLVPTMKKNEIKQLRELVQNK